MKSFFAWCPLAPNGSGIRASGDLANWANRGAVLFLGLGLLQMVAGLDDGLARMIPLVIGMLFFGLPHGAIDHLVVLGLAGKTMQACPLFTVLALYLFTVIAVLALWLFSPAIAAPGFLIMTIYHWGKSDLAFERHCIADAPKFRGFLANGVHLILRGLIPIGLPFLIFPDQATHFIQACVQFFAPERQIDWTLWRQLISAAVVLFFVADLLIHLRHWRYSLARRVVVENLGLTLFFCLVPPMIAIGWYFAGWHGFRHLLRLSQYESAAENGAIDLRVKMTRVGWQTLPFTVVSVIMLGLMHLWMADHVSNSYEGIALYLVLISALTLPHLIVVEWMDRREAVSSND